MRAVIFRSTAALVALFIAMGLQAATVTDVSVIRITSQNNTWLQVSEVIATDGGSNDLALTSAGATTNSSGAGFNGVEANAINGIAPGFCAGGNCSPGAPNLGEGIYHSISPTNAFLEITLASPAEIFTLSIFGRTDEPIFPDRDIYVVELFDMSNNSLFLATNQDANNPQHRVDVFIPIPAAVWLFGSALGFLGWLKRKAA